MKKITMSLGGTMIALVLLGAGCQNASTPASDTGSSSKPAEETTTPKDETKTEETTATPQAEGFNLSAEALGGGAVKFMWDFPGELPADARFVIVRDTMPNPEHTGKHFWHRAFGTKREETWVGVPVGIFHFRICQTDEKEGQCKKYSNDIAIEVK